MQELSIRGQIYPTDLNHYGKAFGGFIMSKMDKAASIAIENILIGSAVTASVSNLVFKKPVNNGDIFSIYTEILHIGHSSIKVYVDFQVKCYENGDEYSVADAEFTFVAIDASGHPVNVCDIARDSISDDVKVLIKKGKS